MLDSVEDKKSLIVVGRYKQKELEYMKKLEPLTQLDTTDRQLRDNKKKYEKILKEMEQKHENLNFAQLKKQAESIRNFFLCPEVMDMNYYQQSDIEALFEKLIAFINSMHEIAELLDSKKDGLILEQVKLLVEYINEFEQKFKAIETEDREHIGDIIDGGVILAGYSVRPEDNREFDITKEWRAW